MIGKKKSYEGWWERFGEDEGGKKGRKDYREGRKDRCNQRQNKKYEKVEGKKKHNVIEGEEE